VVLALAERVQEVPLLLLVQVLYRQVAPPLAREHQEVPAKVIMQVDVYPTIMVSQAYNPAAAAAAVSSFIIALPMRAVRVVPVR
jgi:hypothetical protein